MLFVVVFLLCILQVLLFLNICRRLGNMNQQYTRPSIWQNGRNADGKPSFTYLIYQQVGLAPELGYHWPPFTSVKHLHLHIIFPVSEMSVLSKLIFGLETYGLLCQSMSLID
ncbi:uncharacterized protein LOC143253611 [Tachypleus tridentatus]|uniref:uncharacterized protein LOC143253611 n=1 Tax=Tachypleus tridentatus TaxID=6853 RepID=UPI003FD36B8A